MAKHRLQQVQGIKRIPRVPKGARVVGYLNPANPRIEQAIFAETKEVIVKTPKLDAKGEPRYRNNNRGEPVTPMYDLVKEKKEVEFTLLWSPQGHEMKNYYFRPDPDEQARIDRAAKVKRVQQEIAEALADEDADVGAFVRSVVELAGK